MPKEYIDKEAAIKAFKIAADEYDKRVYDIAVCAGLNTAIRVIKSLPAVDVRENVRATWENVEITQIDVYLGNLPTAITSMFCPVCKRYHNEVYFYGNPIEMARFCGFCGAQMTGWAEDG